MRIYQNDLNWYNTYLKIYQLPTKRSFFFKLRESLQGIESIKDSLFID